MSRDDRIVKYGAVYVPEEKVKETAKRGAPKSSGKMDEIEEAIRELQDEVKKSNRDNLDAMYNIDEDNLSASYRKKIDGQFIKAYAAIKTWADDQSAGFEAVAKWQSETEDKLEGYVTQTNLDASVKSYIEDNTATLVSAVEGSFVKISTDENGKKITETSEVLAAITQQVSSGIAQLSLSVSNGKDYSTIQLKNGNINIGSSQKIKFTGEVVFKGDLSTEGATTINGANITTGTISANRIDTKSLSVESVWLKSDMIHGGEAKILEGVDTTSKIDVRLGLDKLVYDAATGSVIPNRVTLCAGEVDIVRPGYNSISEAVATGDILRIDISERVIAGSQDGEWELGQDDSGFWSVYSTKYYFGKASNGARPYLTISESGSLLYYNHRGESTRLD